MVSTRLFGKLDLIGQVDIRKIGGYQKLGKYVDYERHTISSKFKKFGGGYVYKTQDSKIIITAYPEIVKPRFIPIEYLYVYSIYIMNENDFEIIKDKINFTPLPN
jgi:hypothetical protein